MSEKVRYSDEELAEFKAVILQKLELAKTLHHDYNAGIKQLQRMLKVEQSILTALLGRK